MLFRGVLQTHIGLWAASLIFAVLHFRYLSKWLLFIMVTAISFLLGLMYEWTGNLFVPMTAHFIIDAVFACQIRFEHVRRINMTNMSRVERRKAQNLYEDQNAALADDYVDDDGESLPTRQSVKNQREQKKARQNKNAIIYSTRCTICICAGYRFSYLILFKEPPG